MVTFVMRIPDESASKVADLCARFGGLDRTHLIRLLIAKEWEAMKGKENPDR